MVHQPLEPTMSRFQLVAKGLHKSAVVHVDADERAIIDWLVRQGHDRADSTAAVRVRIPSQKTRSPILMLPPLVSWLDIESSLFMCCAFVAPFGSTCAVQNLPIFRICTRRTRRCCRHVVTCPRHPPSQTEAHRSGGVALSLAMTNSEGFVLSGRTLHEPRTGCTSGECASGPSRLSPALRHANIRRMTGPVSPVRYAGLDAGNTSEQQPERSAHDPE